MSPPLLIVWFSGGLRAKDEEETKAAVENLGLDLDLNLKVVSERWDVALRRLWDYEGDIIVMEHDVVPTVDMAREMLACPSIWCTQLYRLYHASTNLHFEVYGNRYLNDRGEFYFKLADKPYDEYSDAASLCFTKFTHEFRKKIDPKFFTDPTLDLVNLDHKISLKAVELGIKCHVHTPEMKHNHTTLKNEWHTVKKLVFE